MSLKCATPCICTCRLIVPAHRGRGDFEAPVYALAHRNSWPRKLKHRASRGCVDASTSSRPGGRRFCIQTCRDMRMRSSPYVISTAGHGQGPAAGLLKVRELHGGCTALSPDNQFKRACSSQRAQRLGHAGVASHKGRGSVAGSLIRGPRYLRDLHAVEPRPPSPAPKRQAPATPSLSLHEPPRHAHACRCPTPPGCLGTALADFPGPASESLATARPNPGIHKAIARMPVWSAAIRLCVWQCQIAELLGYCNIQWLLQILCRRWLAAQAQAASGVRTADDKQTWGVPLQAIRVEPIAAIIWPY